MNALAPTLRRKSGSGLHSLWQQWRCATRWPARPQSGCCAGFALVEFLLAASLFGIVSALTAAAVVQAYRHAQQARQVQEALRLGADVLESLRATGSPALAPTPGTQSLRWNWAWQPVAGVSGLFEADIEIDADSWSGEPLRLRTWVWRRAEP
jgi:type II secretory pathway pseudopilin PulG